MRYNYYFKSILLIISLLLLLPSMAEGQQKANDSSNTAFIEILASDYTDILKLDNENVTKIVRNVKLRSGTDILYCDSAILFQDRKVAEAFGNVIIEQADGTTAFADYLKYTGGSKLIFMKGDVVLSDNKGNTLWSEEVDYNLSTKIGRYHKSGTLQSDQTILSSQKGEYNLKTKEARFKGDVVVNDPEYNSTSEDLGYNTETKLVRFFADAIVQSDESTLFAKPGGTYDASKKFATLKGRSNIVHGNQFIEADDMKYNQMTGWAVAKGNVIAIDTAEKSRIWCGLLLYNDQTGKMQATEQPVVRRAGEKDTVYQRGDTLFIEPLENMNTGKSGAIDSNQLSMDELVDQLTTGVLVDSTMIPLQIDSSDLNDSLDNDTLFDDIPVLSTNTDTTVTDSLAVDFEIDSNFIGPIWEAYPAIAIVDSISDFLMDSTAKDTSSTLGLSDDKPTRPVAIDTSHQEIPTTAPTANKDKPRYLLLYHNVLVFSDSTQAKCDSMRYSQADSLMILFKNPVIWGKKAQILGDTIFALVDSSKIHEVYVPKNAILVQQNGPDGAGLFDQIQGNRIHAFFKDNELDSALAYPNAETIYFTLDDDSAYIGVSKASSERLRMQFLDRKIKRVHYLKDFEQEMTPMPQVEPEKFRLERFKWREAERPKSLEEFLDGLSETRKKQVLDARKSFTPTE